MTDSQARRRCHLPVSLKHKTSPEVPLITRLSNYHTVTSFEYIPQLRSGVKGVFTAMEDATDAVDKIRGFSELSTSHIACLEALEHLSERTPWGTGAPL